MQSMITATAVMPAFIQPGTVSNGLVFELVSAQAFVSSTIVAIRKCKQAIASH